MIERVDGKWTPSSSTEINARIDAIACGIRDAGLTTGDRIALIGADSVDWAVTDFAIICAGCVVVPIFPTQALDQVGFILRNSEAKMIFVDTPAAEARLRDLHVPLPPIVVFQSSGANSLAAFEERGRAVHAQHPQWPQEFEAQPSPDEMAVLIYTSGTTGEPKGVMLSHRNLVSDVLATFSLAFNELQPGTRTLSVLPFSHIYEHCIMYGYLACKVQHYISHNVDELLTDLKDVRPACITCVPRIFERVIAGVTVKAKIAGGLQAKLVPWALAVGRDYMTAKTRGQNPGIALSLQYRVAHTLVLRKLRPALGLDELVFMCSGSAPLHFDVAMTMLGADIAIVEGYGPTECSPVVSANMLATNRYGTVGKPLPGVQVKIAGDGEILVRGPNVMLGYYKKPEATKDVLEDGWYHTGDIGELDADGYLRITDRKKELFKTSGGKFVAPSRVESAIKRSVYVNQVMLVGDGRPFPVALVSPNWDSVIHELNLPKDATHAQLAAREDVQVFLTREVRENTSDLGKFEQVRRIAILPRDLTIEDGDLSPTLKVRRRNVEAKYRAQIESLYADLSAVHASAAS